jgi:hypothetical protein
MSSKFNNRNLLIAFIALVAIFVFVKFFKSPKTEKTLRTEIVQIDTSKVGRIVLYPSSEQGSEIIFRKESGSNWSVSNGKINAKTGANTVSNILKQLLEIKPIRLESRLKESWNEYNLTDTSATRIKVYEGSKEKLNLLIGKFTYQQTNDPYSGGRGGIKGTSYVRLDGEDEIYAVDGFLTFTFNQPFNNWRDNKFLNFGKENVTRVTFDYQGANSFILTKENNRWMLGSTPADSASVASFISGISFRNSNSFDDDFEPIGNPAQTITVEGNNMESLIIRAFRKAENNYVINSSQNPAAWFTSGGDGLYNEIFKSKENFNLSKK